MKGAVLGAELHFVGIPVAFEVAISQAIQKL